MPDPTHLSDPQAQWALALELTWGDANVLRICRWDTDLTIGGNLYTHEPTLDVKFESVEGGTRERRITASVQDDVEPFSSLGNGEAHPIVYANVYRFAVGASGSERALLRGFVKTARKSPGGRAGTIQLEIAAAKELLEQIFSVPATTTCVNKFGDRLCQYDLSLHSFTGTISALGTGAAQTSITITPDGSPTLTNNL